MACKVEAETVSWVLCDPKGNFLYSELRFNCKCGFLWQLVLAFLNHAIDSFVNPAQNCQAPHGHRNSRGERPK